MGSIAVLDRFEYEYEYHFIEYEYDKNQEFILLATIIPNKPGNEGFQYTASRKLVYRFVSIDREGFRSFFRELSHGPLQHNDPNCIG